MTDWYDQAACRGMDIRLFIPQRGESAAYAKSVCQGCPSRHPCLQYALMFDEHEVIGVWGGTTGRERRMIRRHIGSPRRKGLK